MTVKLETLVPRWDGPCIVAATGSSLTKEVAEVCRGFHAIAVKQAWLRLPWADVLYACDSYWWDLFKGVPEFKGERWSTHDTSINNKLHAAEQYNLRLVRGALSHGFSTNPEVVHYGRNSGFQAINMALHWLRGPKKRVVMVGFDFAQGYFFGEHPKGANVGHRWKEFIPNFEEAARRLPDGVEIVNATPNSALRCFPMMDLAAALA